MPDWIYNFQDDEKANRRTMDFVRHMRRSAFPDFEVDKLMVLVYNIANTISFGGNFYGRKRAEYGPYCGSCCRAYC